jgi:hypothetical protein
MRKPYIVTYMENVRTNLVMSTTIDDFHIKTATVEQSDPDELLMKKQEGPQTFTIERTEPDEVNLSNRISKEYIEKTHSDGNITETTEHIDPDEYVKLSENIETRTVERSEPDELIFFSKTEEITKTFEQTEPDEQFFTH